MNLGAFMDGFWDGLIFGAIAANLIFALYLREKGNVSKSNNHLLWALLLVLLTRL